MLLITSNQQLLLTRTVCVVQEDKNRTDPPQIVPPFVPYSLIYPYNKNCNFVFDSVDLCDAEKSIHQKAK